MSPWATVQRLVAAQLVEAAAEPADARLGLGLAVDDEDAGAVLEARVDGDVEDRGRGASGGAAAAASAPRPRGTVPSSHAPSSRFQIGACGLDAVDDLAGAGERLGAVRRAGGDDHRRLAAAATRP